MTIIEVTSNRWCNNQLSYYLGDKFICTGNDSGKYVMQKSLWCDSLYRQNISTLEIHCHLMLVFGGGVLRPHYLVRGC